MFPLSLSDRHGKGQRLHAACGKINIARCQHLSVIQKRHRNAAIGKRCVPIREFNGHGHHTIRGQLCCRQRQFGNREIVGFPTPHGGQGAIAVQDITLSRQVKFPVPAVPPAEKDIAGFGRDVIRQGQGVAVAMRHRGEAACPAVEIESYRIRIEYIAVLNRNDAIGDTPQSAVLRLVIT